MKTLVLRVDKRLPHRFVTPSPTGQAITVGTDGVTGKEISKVQRYIFTQGVPVDVFDEDYPRLKGMVKHRGEIRVPYFAASVEKARGLSPRVQADQLSETVKSIVNSLLEQNVELPQEVLESVGLVDDDDGGKSCPNCGNLHPDTYSGECLRKCGADIT